MSKLYSLLAESYRLGLQPESVLQLQEERAIPCKAGDSPRAREHKFYVDATQDRFAKVLELYIQLAGVQSAAVVADLSQDIIKGREVASPLILDTMQSFVALFQAGVSLTWWLFGIGKPMHAEPELELCAPDLALRDAIRIMRYKQGWSDLEGRWIITQTHGFSKSKLVHKVICRMMSGLPQIKLFPTMPSVIDVYRRVEDAVKAFVLPPDSETWMRESVAMLKASPWRACVLMLVRQGSISHWHVIKQQPRRKTERLAYVLTLLFNLYGEQDGLEFYLKVLNEEAKAQGFLNLTEVVRGAIWKRVLVRSQED